MRCVLLVLLIVTAAPGQGVLNADLNRAADRYAPATTAPPSEAERHAAEAAEHLRVGRLAEAVAALDRAAGAANKAGATGRAFELSLTAAEAQRSAGPLVDAARRYQHASLTTPKDRRAPAAHHLACQTLAATLEGADEERLDEYEHLLAQHLASWPNTPSAEAVRWEQVELLAKRRRWRALLQRVREVAENDPRRDRAERLLVAAHAGLLQGDTSSEAFAAAREDLQPLFVYAPTPWPEAWSPTQREAAYTLARAAMGQGVEGAEYGRKVLNEALTNRPRPPAAWRHRAGALLTVSWLAVGGTNEATEAFAHAHQGPPAERRRLLAAAYRRIVDPAAAVSIVREADRLAESLDALAEATPRATLQQATVQQATALADAGRDAEARELYQRLAAERPNDREVQTEYARLLQRSSAPTDLEEAARRWRRIESRSERGSDDWFEARLGRLESLTASGQIEDARKLLKLTRLLAPTLGGETMRPQFEAVAVRLGTAN